MIVKLGRSSECRSRNCPQIMKIMKKYAKNPVLPLRCPCFVYFLGIFWGIFPPSFSPFFPFLPLFFDHFLRSGQGWRLACIPHAGAILIFSVEWTTTHRNANFKSHLTNQDQLSSTSNLHKKCSPFNSGQFKTIRLCLRYKLKTQCPFSWDTFSALHMSTNHRFQLISYVHKSSKLERQIVPPFTDKKFTKNSIFNRQTSSSGLWIFRNRVQKKLFTPKWSD